MARSESSSVFSSAIAVTAGAAAALAVGYVAFYILVHFGLGAVASSEGPAFGRGSFSLAALNLYACQHIDLIGRAREVGMSGVKEDVFSVIRVPLSIWALVPAIALVLGGRATAGLVSGRGRTVALVCALLAGLLYAVILAAASRVIHARIDSFLMPQISGFESNPQDSPFRPATRSTLCFAGLFGLAFSYLGGLLAVRRKPGTAPGRLWACVKAVAAAAIVVQVATIALVSLAALSSRKAEKPDDAPRNSGLSVVELLPTAAGLSYALIHGAELVGAVQTHVRPVRRTTRVFYATVGLHAGIQRDDVMSRKSRRFPSVAAAGTLLGVLGALLMGRLAVRWGSRDGSLPAAIRVAAVHTLFLVVVCRVCDTLLVRMEETSVQSLAVVLRCGWWLAASFAAVFLLALIGASGAKRGVPEV